MPSPFKSGLAMLAAALVVAGCANGNPRQDSYVISRADQYESNSRGVIESIRVTRAETNTSGAGAIVGGLVGAILGNQVGGGNGKTAATVVGAVGGAVVGNNVEKNQAQASDMYEIHLRLRNGDSMIIVQDNIDDLHVGNQARVVDGRAYRY